MKKLVIIFLVLFSTNSYALDLQSTLGISTIYNRINNPYYKYSDKWNPIKNIASINVGLSLKQGNYIIGFNTNRLFHKPISRNVKSIQYGTKLKNITNIATDTTYVGYQINRWQPALFLTNARVETGLYQNNTVIVETTKHAILYGASLGYFLTKNIEALIIYIAPNREIYLESGFGIGVNYVF